MIKIQKKEFNIEKEINFIKSQYSNVGATSIFVGYVRDYNNKKIVKSINLEVYEKMAFKALEEVCKKAKRKWNLIDTLIIHRYGNLKINEKIVLVASFSIHRKESFESCDFLMNYLKKEAPFWKKENYKESYQWLENSNDRN